MSAVIVVEFVWPKSLVHNHIFAGFGVNSILYQRGIYPAESFKVQTHYDVPLFVSEDQEIKAFLDNLLSQGEGGYLFISIQFI